MPAHEKAVAAGTAHGFAIETNSTEYCPADDRENQRAILLDHLQRRGHITTAEARRWYSVMSPASRVFELRRQGHGIITRRDPIQKCARYVLVHDRDAEPLQP